MTSKFQRYLAHYFFGLLASCWNAAINAVKISGGISVAGAAAPQLVTAPDLKAMIGIFAAASFWEAIDYFGDHPVPRSLDDLLLAASSGSSLSSKSSPSSASSL